MLARLGQREWALLALALEAPFAETYAYLRRLAALSRFSTLSDRKSVV